MDTGENETGLRRRVIALEDRLDLESGLRVSQGAELAALGVVQRGMLGTIQSLRETQLEHGITLADHGRLLEATHLVLEAMETGLITVDATVDNLDVRFDDLEVKVDGLEGKVDGLDGKVEALGDDVGVVKVSVERILAHLDGSAE